MSLDQVTQQQWKKIISCNLMELPITKKLLKIQYLPQHNLGLKKLRLNHLHGQIVLAKGFSIVHPTKFPYN
jgi:hypothetical protein